MKFSKNAALMAAAILVFFGAHAAVDALDRYEEKKATPVYVVEISEPKDVIALPTEPKVKAIKTVVEIATVAEPATEPEPTYSEAELEMLALVIYQEAGGDACSDETRLMVGNVVMNRVADDRFPDSIEEVLTQKQQYGRLYWTGLVWPERADQAGEAHAVERAYRCAEEVLSGVRLLPDDVIFQAEFVQGEIVAEQDGFYFCRG